MLLQSVKTALLASLFSLHLTDLTARVGSHLLILGFMVGFVEQSNNLASIDMTASYTVECMRSLI